MKNKIGIIGVGVFVAIIVGIFIFRTREYDSKPTKPSSQTITSQELQEYLDPAGFKFSYPRSVTVSPIKIGDSTVYSSLRVTSPSKLGNMSIEAVSSSLLTLENLIPKNSKVIDIKLADLLAKQYTEKNKVVTFALDKGVLFTITVSSGEDVNFWNEVNNKILSTFTFVPPETTQDTSDSVPSESDVSFEGEETIE